MKLLLLLAAVGVATSTEDIEKRFVELTSPYEGAFIKEVAASNPGKSVILSAFSVLPPLALISQGSTGEGHDEILKKAGLQDDEFIRSAVPKVLQSIDAVEGVTLKMAMKVYVSDASELNSDFEAVSKTLNSESQSVNFNKNVDTAALINSWVESKTNDKIKDLVKADSLDGLTRIVLVNAIYFKGDWATKFNEDRTKKGDFYLSADRTNKIERDFMEVESEFKYYHSDVLKAKILEMPYVNKEVSMLIVLPDSIEGLTELLDNMKTNPTALTEETKKMYKDRVEVKFPKFKIETTTDLKDLLQKLGFKLMFDSAHSGITKMLKSGETLYVSEATQKAFIEVNEQGSEAAVANMVNLYLRSGRIIKRNFTADRPFYFCLVTAGQPLFSGVFYVFVFPGRSLHARVNTEYFTADRPFFFSVVAAGHPIFSGVFYGS